ncbi:MAG: YfhO family protein [Acidobacteria bacterium]|nr:YfhO family protein [Acidobacteriota bacterium]
MAENHHIALKAPWKGKAKHALMVLFLLLMTVGFYWKLTLTRQYNWFDHPDMCYLEIPRIQFQMREIRLHGNFPLWDPHIWTGQPLIGQTQPGLLFPLNLLFELTPMRDGYMKFAQLNYYWAAIHFLGALFAFWLARDIGLSYAASLFCGAVFGYGGFVGSVAWIDVINGGIWAPLILLFILRAAQGSRPYSNAALAGLFLGIAWLSGHHEIPILLTLMSGLLWLWFAARNRRLILPAAVYGLTMFLIGAVQTLPTFEFGRMAVRWVGLENSVKWDDKIPYSVSALYSLPAKGLLATFLPAVGNYADSSPFIGCIAVALTLFAIAARWSNQAVRIATAIMAGSIVYSLGANTPLQGIMYSILPVVDKARIPSRGTLVLSFALAILAAIGLDTILRDSLSPAIAALRRWLLGFGVLLLILCFAISQAKTEVDDRLFLAAGVSIAAAVLLAAWQRGALTRGIVAAGLVSLTLIELTGAAPALYNDVTAKDGNKFTKSLTEHADIVEFLKNQKHLGPLRVVVDDQTIGSNFGDWHGIDMLHGYVAGVNRQHMEHELHTQRTQSLYSITHFIGMKPDKPGQKEVFTGTSGVKVFENPGYLPRARSVHDTKKVDDSAWMRIHIQDANVDLAKTALFLENPPQLETCAAADTVAIRQHDTDHVAIDATMACRGMVILSETMYPGWQATIDGNPARIWEAYGVFRGVVVEAGNHRIDFRFRPRTVYYGAALTALGLILVAGLCLARR